MSYLEQSASPVDSPTPGNPPPPGASVGGAPEQQRPSPPIDEETERQVVTWGAKAKKILYGDEKNFVNMMSMLEQAGPEGFSQAASTIVNTVLDQLEAEDGQQSPEILAAVGTIILGAIAEDLTVGGAMQVTPQMFEQAAAKAMNDWMSNNPDRVDAQATMREVQQMQGGQAPSPQAPAQAPPQGGTPPQQPPAQGGAPTSYMGGM